MPGQAGSYRQTFPGETNFPSHAEAVLKQKVEMPSLLFLARRFSRAAIGLRSDYLRCPKLIPSFKACCLRAPAVRFIAREILATGVLFFE
jgi:hypothetical protein